METILEQIKLLLMATGTVSATIATIAGSFVAGGLITQYLKEKVMDKYIKNENLKGWLFSAGIVGIPTFMLIGIGNIIDPNFGNNHKIVEQNTIHQTGIKTEGAKIVKENGISNKDKMIVVLKNQNNNELEKILKNTNFNNEEIIQLKKQFYLIKHLEKEAKNNPQLQEKVNNLKNIFMKYVNEHKINNTVEMHM